MAQQKRETYEAPEVTDFGSIEEVTKGTAAVSLDDVPLGRKVFEPGDPTGGGSSALA